MSSIFLKILNMSISASYLILAVVLLRLALKKAPKWISVLLFGIVAVRLICPISIESVLSLIPSAETVSPDIMMNVSPEINSGIPVIDNAVNPVISNGLKPQAGDSVNPMQTVIFCASAVWLAGAAALVIYAFVSYLKIKKRVATAVLDYGNIFKSENVGSPFVLGIIKPKIYLPFGLDKRDEGYVVAHEMAHIRRRDYIWKPIGYLLLIIHWFNPLVWVGYILLCRDIESACDEKVIKELGASERADYSQALLSCSVSRRIITACPIAFGEQGVKDRVKSVLNYKKPAFWIIVIAIIATVALTVFFLTNPISDDGIIAPDDGSLLYLGTGEISEQAYKDAQSRYESGGYTPIVSTKKTDRVSIKTDFRIKSVDANGPSMVVKGFSELDTRTYLSIQTEKSRKEALIDVGWWYESEKSDFDSGLWSYIVRITDSDGAVHNYYFRVKYGESVDNSISVIGEDNILYGGKGNFGEYEFINTVHRYTGECTDLNWSSNGGVILNLGYTVKSVQAKVFSPSSFEDFSTTVHKKYFAKPTLYGEKGVFVDIGWVYRAMKDKQIGSYWSYLICVTDENDELHNYYFRVLYADPVS